MKTLQWLIVMAARRCVGRCSLIYSTLPVTQDDHDLAVQGGIVFW